VLRRTVAHVHWPESTSVRVRRQRWPLLHRLAECPHPCPSGQGAYISQPNFLSPARERSDDPAFIFCNRVRTRCGLKLIHDFLRLSSCPRTAYQNWRSAPKTKRSGTQPNESGWRSGGAVSFSPTPTGMRNGAEGPPPLGELRAATRLARLQ
jgi:hypothetical protein